MKITSKSIKNIISNKPDQQFRISSEYNGEEIVCKYVQSYKSITEFVDIKTGEHHLILRGNMKYVHSC
jgi:hypothetical protein